MGAFVFEADLLVERLEEIEGIWAVILDALENGFGGLDLVSLELCDDAEHERMLVLLFLHLYHIYQNCTYQTNIA